MILQQDFIITDGMKVANRNGQILKQVVDAEIQNTDTHVVLGGNIVYQGRKPPAVDILLNGGRAGLDIFRLDRLIEAIQKDNLEQP